MKKTTIFFILISLFCISTKAQDLAFREGNAVFSLGSGYPNMDKYLYTHNMNNSVKGAGPLHLRVGFGLSNRIEMGLSLNYAYATEDVASYMSSWRAKIHNFSGLIRMNIHFAVTEKIDPYFGIGAGFRTQSASFSALPGRENEFFYMSDYYDSDFPFGMELVLGMRYYFNNKIGFYTELGMAKSIMQLGICYKL